MVGVTAAALALAPVGRALACADATDPPNDSGRAMAPNTRPNAASTRIAGAPARRRTTLCLAIAFRPATARRRAPRLAETTGTSPQTPDPCTPGVTFPLGWRTRQWALRLGQTGQRGVQTASGAPGFPTSPQVTASGVSLTPLTPPVPVAFDRCGRARKIDPTLHDRF